MRGRYRLKFRNASDDIHPLHLHRHSFELTRTEHVVRAGSTHLSWSETLSSQAWTHGSSTPGEPDTPTPAMTSSPSLTGSPPGMAMTLGKVTCWRTTGSLSAKRLA